MIKQLLTYKPGNIRFVYVIGTLGTEEQANIVINAAETSIVQVNNSFPGIVLTGAKDLLLKATAARDGGKFTDAEKMADQANDEAIAAGRDFDSAQKALTNAEAQINMASMNGSGNNPATRQMLERANNEFAIGNYLEARNSADAACFSNRRCATSARCVTTCDDRRGHWLSRSWYRDIPPDEEASKTIATTK